MKAQTKGLDDPIIVVLDLQDDDAAELAHSTGIPWDQIEQSREECRSAGVVPTHVLALPRESVSCVVAPAPPSGPREIAPSNRPGTFRVVAIASNGNSFADFPAPPASHLDETGG